MNRKLNPELIDADNPEWTAAEALTAKTFSAQSDTLKNKLARRARGAQLTPTKARITIRLSPNVVETFKATGSGWQSRMDGALQDWLKTHAL